jgi:putative nucleic acid binding protein
MSVAVARQAPYPVRAEQRRCAKCGKLVSREAYACRRCGKKQRFRPRTMLLGLAACLMFAMFGVASTGALMGSARPTEAAFPLTASRQAPVAVSAPAASAGDLTAADLSKAYSADPASADGKYRDRSLVVSGTVRSLDRDFEGNMVVRLAAGDSLDTVNATLATRNDPAMASLAKGRPVSLLCVGRGTLMGAPRLASCYLR